MNVVSGRANDHFRATAIVARSLLALLLAAASVDGRAESTQLGGQGGGAIAMARLDFKIIIPPMLMLDTKSGTVYSNDGKTIALLGTMDASASPDSPRASAAGLRPVAATNGWNRAGKRGAPGGRMATRDPANGDIVCIP